MKRIWIVDGHNVIFAIPGLKEMQRSGRGEEARDALAETLRRFAQSRREQVLLVFDGSDQVRNPGAPGNPFLETVYTRSGVGTADDRIIKEARARSDRGQHVTVVTNDVTTLAVELPRRVLHLKVRAFWGKYIEPDADPEGKEIEGDFSEVERELAARAASVPAEPVARIHVPKGPAAAPAVWTDEKIKQKKERGRLRQERRLKRRPNPGPSR